MRHHSNTNAVTMVAVLILTAALVELVPVNAKTSPRSQSPGSSQSSSTTKGTAMYLKTSAFQLGSEIPQQFTCEGQDLSPALQWGDAPAGTQSFALIAEDPDAPSGTFTHWVLFDLPSNVTELPQGVTSSERLDSGGKQGKNDFGKIGYGSPCPPPGKAHRYFFKLYALDTKLGLKPSAKKQDVERAMKGHILAQAEIMGKYQRKGKAAA